jgi:DNA adenine methylase
LHREGPNGFNVPFGNYKNPNIIDTENILLLSDLFKNVIFTVASFETMLLQAKEGDFIYLDPPYVQETLTSFVSYTKDKFDKNKHFQLFNECYGLTNKNVKFVMSNADVQMIQDSFKMYSIYTIQCKRAINSKSPNSTTNEVLITNFTQVK